MRRLVAIMFTDIEGSTSLMQDNEAKALHQLDQYKQSVVSKIKTHGGKLIKHMGDGTLSIFHSSFQAVSCAIALQQEFCTKKSIPVRIGIHQGEVIVENKDVFGDAVNLTSRIQNAGVSGAVLISEKVKDELSNHPEIISVPLGEYHLKNVTHPLKLFAVQAEGLTIPAVPVPVIPVLHVRHRHLKESGMLSDIPEGTSVRRKWKYPLLMTLAAAVLLTIFFLTRDKENRTDRDLKIITILPFEDIGEGANSYLSEALTQEIINLLSLNTRIKVIKINQQLVNSQGKSIVAGVSADSDAGYVLEGLVQHFRDSIKVFVTLKDSRSNHVIWANKPYFRKFEEQLLLQTELAQEIADALEVSFSSENIQLIAKRNKTPPDAYTWYIRGRYAQQKRSFESLKEAIQLFEKAIEIDSTYALAYTGISDNFTILIDNGFLPFDSGYDKARDALRNAYRYDSNLAEVRASKAIFLSSLEGKRKEAIHELETSLRMNPKYANAQQWYAIELLGEGRFTEALDYINRALEAEPKAERILFQKGLILLYARRFREALQVQDQLLFLYNNSTTYYRIKAESHYRLGNNDSAIYFARQATEGIKDNIFWNAVINKDYPGLKKRVDETPKNNIETRAVYLAYLNDNQKTIDELELAFENKEYSWLRFLRVCPDWDSLRSDPRFENLIKRLN